jgi:hypothetical protein
MVQGQITAAPCHLRAKLRQGQVMAGPCFGKVRVGQGWVPAGPKGMRAAAFWGTRSSLCHD